MSWLLVLFLQFTAAKMPFLVGHHFSTLMQKWKSTPDVYLWSIDTSESRFWWLFILVHAVAWMIIFIELMIMDPGELIGLKQIYFYHTRKSAPLSYKSKELQLFYKHFRHPGPLGIWLMLWVHPVMTLDRLVLAVSWSLYIFIAYSVSLNGFKFAKSYFQVQRSRSVYYRPT
ncbi:nurim homolog isoform X2 [Pomacea canaliculata]|uniref:nurim homolog isoform X2 n=1 Tax=Pomacea canaliculata TaxID=400727 RepID=UPI000D73864A|nr:nurim homolog isoform X2 [Pomacea canaliculata]